MIGDRKELLLMMLSLLVVHIINSVKYWIYSLHIKKIIIVKQTQSNNRASNVFTHKKGILVNRMKKQTKSQSQI